MSLTLQTENRRKRSAELRALLVEDDLTISQFVQKGLTEAGYSVTVAYDGEGGLALAEKNGFDIVIVDVMLPKLDGLSLVKTLRDRGVTAPVLILSAKHSIEDRVSGLQIGGDDYLIKPFAFPELLARMEALLRRSQQPKAEPVEIVAGDLHLDLLKREAYRNGTKIELKSKEFALLEFLMKNQNRVVTKSEILEAIWGYNFDPQTNVVDVLVCRLRNRIDREFADKSIQTVRGIGYVLKTV